MQETKGKSKHKLLDICYLGYCGAGRTKYIFLNLFFPIPETDRSIQLVRWEEGSLISDKGREDGLV